MKTRLDPRRLDHILDEVRAEVVRAQAKHAPMHSAHEAFGVIFEEFMIEYAAELKSNNAKAQRTEMIQCAAMCIRALFDVHT